MGATEKHILRRTLLAQRQQLSDEALHATSLRLCSRLHDWLIQEGIMRLALYRAFRKEPLLESLEERWPAHLRYYPRITARRQMEFRSVPAGQVFATHAMGMQEPPQDGPLLPCDQTTALVVPAIAYDKAGYRLGYGGGYYDVFLASFPGKVIGVCFEAFIFDALPREAHDQPVQKVLTEHSIY
jgi:5-formyltetrahydrofolate cyclo-ligase